MCSPPVGVVWLSRPEHKGAGAVTVPHGAPRPRSLSLRCCEALGAPRSCQSGLRLRGSEASAQDHDEQSCKGLTRNATAPRSLTTAGDRAPQELHEPTRYLRAARSELAGLTSSTAAPWVVMQTRRPSGAPAAREQARHHRTVRSLSSGWRGMERAYYPASSLPNRRLALQ